jgi:hypothetical protein
MKAYWGSGGIAPRIPDLSTRCRWVVSFTPWPLYPQGKSLWYPLERRLGGTQSRFERGGEEKISQPLPGLEPLIIQPVAQRYTTELSQLLSGLGGEEKKSRNYHCRELNPGRPAHGPVCIVTKGTNVFSQILLQYITWRSTWNELVFPLA